MMAEVEKAKAANDSVGGVVNAASPAFRGLGEPVFDKLDAELAKAMLSIARSRASNSAWASPRRPAGQPAQRLMDSSGFLTNNAAASWAASPPARRSSSAGRKPTSSIAALQRNVNLAGEEVEVRTRAGTTSASARASYRSWRP
jgi:chorismate synthase